MLKNSDIKSDCEKRVADASIDYIKYKTLCVLSGLEAVYLATVEGSSDDVKTEEPSAIGKDTNKSDAQTLFVQGENYLLGRGVPENKTKAVECYKEAAKLGHVNAQYYLGYFYQNGKGVAEDKVEALEWYRKAAEQEHVQAQYTLGECYERGIGVETDNKDAVKWYRKAAEQKYAQAQYALARCYEQGIGVKINTDEAISWYHNAAKNGHAQSQYILGMYYLDLSKKERTFFVKPKEEKLLLKAYEYLVEANNNGHLQAKVNYDKMLQDTRMRNILAKHGKKIL